MRVFVIDASNMGPEFQGGLIGVVGSVFPTAEEKNECVDTVSRYAADGWAVAADPRTLIGRLAALTAEAAQSPAGAQGLFWLPYLMGERTPHLDATARGGWVGLTASHTRADLIRAVIEGVSYSQRDCLEIIEALGVPVSSVRASGGGAKSAFWRGLLSGILNKRVVTLETQEGSAYGAALLALAGWGVVTLALRARRPAADR